MEDYYRTTQTAIQAGAGPDIIQLSGPGYALEYWSAGQLSDMSDLAAHYGWESRLLGWAYESGTSADGSLITLPMHYETLLLFYNETLFEKYGLQPPVNRADVERVCNLGGAGGADLLLPLRGAQPLAVPGHVGRLRRP